MSKRRVALILALLLAPAREAMAQQRSSVLTAFPAPGGTIDFGARIFDISGDPARDQRYRDLRSGPTLDRFRYTRDRRTWLFNAGADHVGYRDQHYFARFTIAGSSTARSRARCIPRLPRGSRSSRTTPSSCRGVFRIDDAIQRGIQAGTLKLSDVAPTATVFDLRSRREIAAFQFTVTPTRESRRQAERQQHCTQRNAAVGAWVWLRQPRGNSGASQASDDGRRYGGRVGK